MLKELILGASFPQADLFHLLSGVHISHVVRWKEVPLSPHAAKVLLFRRAWCLVWVSPNLWLIKIWIISISTDSQFLFLCRTFNWALSMGGRVPVTEGLEHADLPDGTGEFLDAWLMLVEKMVNPSTVLDSPHSLPAKMPGVTPTMPQFSALRFLIVTQKVSFILCNFAV